MQGPDDLIRDGPRIGSGDMYAAVPMIMPADVP